jgi:hypothetical protein
MLPGGKTAAPLKGYATYTQQGTWPNVPLASTTQNFGKIQNILLAQAIVLYFNIGQDRPFDLSSLRITGKYLVTAKAQNCGTRLAIPYEDIYTMIPQNVINYMNSNYGGSGGATVGNLLVLANHILGGGIAGTVTPSNITSALDAINRAFDGCRILVRFTDVDPSMISARGSYSPEFAGTVEVEDQMADEKTLETTVAKVRAEAYPNPFSDKVTIRLKSEVDTQAVVEVYNMAGSKVKGLFSGRIEAGKDYSFEFSDPGNTGTMYLYKVSTAEGVQVGKLMFVPSGR